MKLEIEIPDEWIVIAEKRNKFSYWMVETAQCQLTGIGAIEGTAQAKLIFCIYPKTKKKPRRFTGEIYLKKKLDDIEKEPVFDDEDEYED